MHRKIHLDIDYTDFLSQQKPEGSSCSTHQAVEQADIHQKNPGGFPKSFCLENTTIHQRWWTKEDRDYDELNNKLGIETITVSTIIQPPGNCVPLHRDTFYKIKQEYPENKRVIVRCNIFMQDWKTGHFVQYDDKVDTHWKQGDGHMWDDKVLHIGANAGMEDKYTLQVSGFLK